MKLIKRKLLIIGAAGVIILGGVVVGSVLLAPGPAAGQRTANPALPPATAPVTRTTLVETRTVGGTLGYGDPVPVRANGAGTLTWIAPVGATVARGEPLFKVDERPVVALYGSVPLYRTLTNRVEGADVRQLQENLAELGYTGFAIDGIYTSATAAAVRAWQADLGLPQTGIIEPGQVVFTPGVVRVAEHTAHVGDLLSGGGAPVLSHTGTTRLVTVDLRVADQALAVEGREVVVTLPGGQAVTGTIAQVGTVVTAQEIEVTVTITEQEALGALEVAPVDVDFVSAARADVLVVPVAALLALAEGGYGVEVVAGNTSHIVPVRTGMFAGGRVEVSGEGIAEGMRVGVPR